MSLSKNQKTLLLMLAGCGVLSIFMVWITNSFPEYRENGRLSLNDRLIGQREALNSGSVDQERSLAMEVLMKPSGVTDWEIVNAAIFLWRTKYFEGLRNVVALSENEESRYYACRMMTGLSRQEIQGLVNAGFSRSVRESSENDNVIEFSYEPPVDPGAEILGYGTKTEKDPFMRPFLNIQQKLEGSE